MTDFTVAKGVHLDNSQFWNGDIVTGILPIDEHGVSYFLGPLELPGITGWVSFFRLVKPVGGQTIWVNAATSAAGQVVGQLAKRARIRNSTAGLFRLAPEGLDVAYDNVGSEHFAAAVENMKWHGMIISAGFISELNTSLEERFGIKSLGGQFWRRIRVRGSIWWDDELYSQYGGDFQEKMQTHSRRFHEDRMDFSTRFGDKVLRCEDIIKYSFRSKVLCAEALNTAGDAMSAYVSNGSFLRMSKNGRLAIYGDAVANLHLCGFWLELRLEKHHWTTIRGEVLGNKNLSQVGEEHGLDKCINVNGGTPTVSTRMIATAVQAILGAVHKDGGHVAFAGVMDRLGLTEHALLSSVTSSPYTHPPYTDQLQAYLLDLLDLDFIFSEKLIRTVTSRLRTGLQCLRKLESWGSYEARTSWSTESHHCVRPPVKNPQ
ncbi:hypothetical protein DL770_000070 [Monosporascus sp. CRB-9-2]|nr:hypothetical protein DL770_000070 [Monosporascus sp. CRB-9-2]